MASVGRLANKIAIVTGAASGIGRATAFAYVKEGAKVVCADIRETTRFDKDEEESRGTTVERIKDLGGEAFFHKVDVTDEGSVEGLVQAAVKEYGRLDVMVNNAGVSLEATNFRPVWEISMPTWLGTQAVNSTGVFLGTKYAVRQMLSQQPLPSSSSRGWIINTSSILGFVGAEHTAAYCASKGAVLNFTRAAALDCGKYGINVNGLAPGYTRSSMTGPLWEDDRKKGDLERKHPLRGLGRPEDLARAAVFLASEDAGWVTGHTLPVEGGYLAQ